jgi:hypothetical protein
LSFFALIWKDNKQYDIINAIFNLLLGGIVEEIDDTLQRAYLWMTKAWNDHNKGNSFSFSENIYSVLLN